MGKQLLKLFELDGPVVMGILNITPDSFSDGGELFSNHQLHLDAIIQRAVQMQHDGALILDVGGESTRPGAEVISEQEELERVIPVIEILKKETDLCLSIDTSKPQVMQEAIRAGADFVNDVCALQKPGAMKVVGQALQENQVQHVCLMHMQNNPQTMQQKPHYENVVQEVKHFLQLRLQACQQNGIDKKSIVLDPGFGFGKSLEHNLQLLRHLGVLHELGCPILVGFSRKRMIGALTDSENPGSRLPGSLALGWAAVERGAKILRVHDVKETVDFLKVMAAL